MSKWGYKEVVAENGRANGRRLEHRVVAEQIIGRLLTDEEVVHHIDNNRSNNSPDNLMVFATDADHARFHAGGIATKQEDGTYIASSIRDKLCIICGTTTVNNKFCSIKCKGLASRKAEQPSKEELVELIKTTSMVQLGKKYGVTDNAVKKWAKRYGII